MLARLRPVTFSAAVAAAIAALFQPIPAMAAPAGDRQPLAAAGVPDTGSRPIQLGSLVLPNTPINTTTVSTIPGSATNPVLQQIEKGRVEVDQLGDQLLKLKADRDLAQTRVTTAAQAVTEAQTNLQGAQSEAVAAAGQAMQQAAAVPPGALDSGLLGLDQLARLQRGETPTDDSSARRLEAAQISAQIALDEQTTATSKYDGLLAQYEKLNARLDRKQSAQQKLEAAHKDELALAESIASATDQALGQQYLSGATAGMGSDPRAIQALQFALAQRGDPYVWSEEGPDEYDCSGLMYAAYHSVGFPLVRVSRDQYWQTRNKVVDRYSLLPGDLLFFSYSNSWTGIHHVAMYAGDGMMVEAPRTGLNVRLTPVRWSQLFQATRVFGSVAGGSTGISIGSPDPDEPANHPTTKPPVTTTTKPPVTTTTKPPVTTSPTTKPGGGGSTGSPTTPSTPSSPSTSPSRPKPTPTPTKAPTTKPAPDPSPSGGNSSSSGSGGSSSGSTGSGGSSSGSSGSSSGSSGSSGSSSGSGGSSGSSSGSSGSSGSSSGSSGSSSSSGSSESSAEATKSSVAATTSSSEATDN
ncbi:hypothetical protein Asi03nite_71120 [Actinoplanes siamensis]|uniref:NlpC/P60 domain-containing protein n=1 Tax=Actinoplanes siamensis TaxID=1223317 RepID=A0A919NE48_9ACTN|nr:C40 family peptidase [Actinoplanes siamensis]GIF09574.1 hypothetical protein Asi03nite_71120 [Actinoplanes siamensis]